MRTFILILVLACIFNSIPVMAQSQYVVGIFASNVTNPNAASPVSAPIAYTPTCNQAFAAESPQPIVNPTEGRFQDPVNTTRDCLFNFTSQVSALGTGNYKAAIRPSTGTTWGTLTTAFSRAQVVSHPCDGADPTSGTVVAGSRTVTWCYPDNTDGGSPLTGFAMYQGTTRVVVPIASITVGTANSAGRRLYSAVQTFSPGAVLLKVSPVNAIGEGMPSLTYTLTVNAPATAPTGTPGIRGVN